MSLYTVEGQTAGMLAEKLAAQRETARQDFEKQRAEMSKATEHSLKGIEDRFRVTEPATGAAAGPVGLLHMEDMRRARLQEEARQEAGARGAASAAAAPAPAPAAASKTAPASAAAATGGAGQKRKRVLLSIADEDEEEEEGGGSGGPVAVPVPVPKRPSQAQPQPTKATTVAVAAASASASVPAAATDSAAASASSAPAASTNETAAAAAAAAEPASKRVRVALTKDPGVATDFLPDAARDRAEAELVARIRAEWEEAQAAARAEPLEIVFSYWDGSGHRRSVSVAQGSTIGRFLELARHSLMNAFPELRYTSASDLVYVKEDLIIPHHHTFYELIVNKARGKSGPLFEFGVKDDVRLVNDSRKEKEDSHPGKIVERRWYERNKHIFPASRWEVYEAGKSFEEYSTHGREVHGPHSEKGQGNR